MSECYTGKSRRVVGKLAVRQSRGQEFWCSRFQIQVYDRNTRQLVGKQIRRDVGLLSEMSQSEAQRELRRIVSHERALAEKRAAMAASFGERERHKQPSDTPNRNRGAMAEMTVCADLLRRGFEVFRAINAISTTDLVALIGGSAFRVEVKYGIVRKRGAPICDHERNKGKFDLLAVVTPDLSVRYFDSGISPIENPEHNDTT